MGQIKLHRRTFKVKITSAEIQKSVADVARQMNTELNGKNPLFLAILNGAFMFAADLMKKLTIPCEISFVKLASYQDTTSTGSFKQLIGINEDLQGRTVVILEDVVDSGATIDNVLNQLQDLGAAEIKIATLLFKPDAYTKNAHIDYAAMIVPNDFLVGYGLDYNRLGRNYPDIYVLDYSQEKS